MYQHTHTQASDLVFICTFLTCSTYTLPISQSVKHHQFCILFSSFSQSCYCVTHLVWQKAICWYVKIPPCISQIIFHTNIYAHAHAHNQLNVGHDVSDKWMYWTYSFIVFFGFSLKVSYHNNFGDLFGGKIVHLLLL